MNRTLKSIFIDLYTHKKFVDYKHIMHETRQGNKIFILSVLVNYLHITTKLS